MDLFVDRHTDAASGITTVAIRMTSPGAALLMGRLRRMAKTVCTNDPRTLDQRMSDAAEALAADSNRLKCLCGSPTCPAAADDEVGSRFVIHVYAEAAALTAEPDTLILGEKPDTAAPPAPESAAASTPDEPGDDATDQSDDDSGTADPSTSRQNPQMNRPPPKPPRPQPHRRRPQPPGPSPASASCPAR